MIVRLAIATPLRRLFDYLPPPGHHPLLQPGMRVSVPFGRQQKIGVILSLEQTSEVPRDKLKAISHVIDEQPLLPASHLDWLSWLSNYYHHSLGDTVFSALPTLLRQNHPAQAKTISLWQLTTEGRDAQVEQLKRAPKQASLLSILQADSAGQSSALLDEKIDGWRPAMKKLLEKNWVVEIQQSSLASHAHISAQAPLRLNQEQHAACEAVRAGLGSYHCFLLDGVTGSGKTEVYLQIIEQVLTRGEQAMVLVPEIGLTPQLLDRFIRRFPQPMALLHSGLNDTERLNNWLAAKSGEARIIIGTRSAIFTPLAKPGIIIIDEEHDASFKQGDGLRYHTRDIALVRANRQGIPVLLGSATPSLESLYNCQQKRFTRLRLQKRAGHAAAPGIETLDLRNQPMLENISHALLRETKKHLERGNQVLFFLNRRGFAPTLICHQCGNIEMCRRCDTHMTLHQQSKRLCCHHCGSERPIPHQCPSCGELDIRPQGFGTERVEKALAEHFANYEVIRIDRDTTRRKGSFEALLDKVHSGAGQILLGTQMLAKGHDFPNVTLVGILDADGGLFSMDFRATERLAQLVTQVAGRAGRGDKPGKVIIQTHHPEHPLLTTLIRDGFHAFAEAALDERRQAQFPPYRFAALIRAEATAQALPMDVLSALHTLSENHSKVEFLGPVPAVIEKRAGRFRAQLLLIAEHRRDLHALLAKIIQFLENHKDAKKVRWSVDVDPQDMS
ncbi:MAG: primosomal protein N' [Gammaproteobacteria bacterium]|nr:primosomal protein N' [Gammaproteobacteria bacterium]